MAGKWLSTLEAAEQIGVSHDTILAFIRGGHLTVKDVSAGTLRKRWKVSEESIDAFDSMRTEAATRGPVVEQRQRLARLISDARELAELVLARNDALARIVAERLLKSTEGEAGR